MTPLSWPATFLLLQAVISMHAGLVTVPFMAAQSTPAAQLFIGKLVAEPSSEFTTYTEGEVVQVSVPSNWRELPGSNAVTFAPEGAYGNVGVRSVFTHGLEMGLARNDQRDLRRTTDTFIASQLSDPRSPARSRRQRKATIDGRSSLHTVLSRVSEATGESEQIEIYTTLLHDGTLFYVLAIVPDVGVVTYAPTFRRVVDSIAIKDCDPCVR